MKIIKSVILVLVSIGIALGIGFIYGLIRYDIYDMPIIFPLVVGAVLGGIVSRVQNKILAPERVMKIVAWIVGVICVIGILLTEYNAFQQECSQSLSEYSREEQQWIIDAYLKDKTGQEGVLGYLLLDKGGTFYFAYGGMPIPYQVGDSSGTGIDKLLDLAMIVSIILMSIRVIYIKIQAKNLLPLVQQEEALTFDEAKKLLEDALIMEEGEYLQEVKDMPEYEADYFMFYYMLSEGEKNSILCAVKKNTQQLLNWDKDSGFYEF